MKKTNQRLLYILLPLFALVVYAVFSDALSDLWKEDIKAMFWHNKWALLFIVLLLALVGYLWERQQRSENTAPEAVDKDQYEEAFVQFRKNLLEQYQIRLNSKTGRRLPINLSAKSTHFGMTPERVEAYFKDKDLTIESENIASEIDKILKTNDRLLLIGDPGAGKTTILLYAAINILHISYSSDDLKSSDELQKLPLLLNLATWSEGRDFAEWYAQSIAHTYSLNPVFVQELLRRNAVVPFFDGFDEVAEKYRDDCFRQMAAYFGDRRDRQLIVSSRKKEYAAAEADAPVYAEIEVQPLSVEQIKKALKETGESQAADRALLHALDRDRWLAGAVETPFYLNTASFLFGKGQRTLADFPFQADSTEGRQAELVEIFVAGQVPEKQDKKYLHFLAGKMEMENFLVFELVSMQPKWGGSLWRFKLVTGLFHGFIVGLGSGLAFSDPIFGLFMGLLFLLTASFENEIKDLETDRDAIRIWAGRKITWKVKLAQALLLGLTDALIITIIFSFYKGLAFGLISGFTIGLPVSFVVDFCVPNIRINYLSQIRSPYQRFKFVFRFNFLIVLEIGLRILLLVVLVVSVFELDTFWEDLMAFEGNVMGKIALLPLILIFLFSFSNLHKHFALRLVLYLEGKMPLRVVTFMDRMSEQLIFEDNRRSDKKGKKRRGATWRFRHKILQDYFARHFS